MCTLELFSILKEKLIGYADDSTLIAVVPSTGVRITVAESLILDLGRVSEWCDLWGMTLNASKNKTMRVSKSCAMHPQSPPLIIGKTVLKESDDPVILGAMHPLNGALPGPYVPTRITRGALVSHRFTYGPPCCRTSLYRMTFIPLSVSLWNDRANPVFDGAGLAGFKSRANAFSLA